MFQVFPISARARSIGARPSLSFLQFEDRVSGLSDDLFDLGLVQSAQVDARSLLRTTVALGGGGATAASKHSADYGG